MTVQQKIDEIVKKCEEAMRYIPAEEREEAMRGVKELGYEWQNANVTGRVMGIAAGLMAQGMTFDDIQEGTSLFDFEDVGTQAIFKALPLPVYSALHTKMLTDAMGGLTE